MSPRILFSLLTALLSLRPVSGQRPSFDVASIKVNRSSSSGGSIGMKGSRFVAANVTIKGLMMYAYAPPNGRMLYEQIVGGPDWTGTDRFNIEANLEGDAAGLPREQIKLMLQSLLEDRFRLRIRREVHKVPVYDLLLTKKRPNVSPDQTTPDRRQTFITYALEGQELSPLPRGALRIVNGSSVITITGTAVSVPRIVDMIQGKSDRVIIDRTGFKPLIDVNMQFENPVAALDASVDFGIAPQLSPSLFSAVQEIGFKLQPSKAPLEVLVVEAVQRPSDN